MKISKSGLVVIGVMLLIGIFVFYLLFLSEAIGVKVIAQIETTNSYLKAMDSIQNVTESTKNAALETLVRRDHENNLLKKRDSVSRVSLMLLGAELKLLKNELQERDAKIDSLEAGINDLSNQLRRSSIEQRYKE